jgi:hypothetical protein
VPSYYSIVQFLPDPIRDERINVGVLAYDDSGAVTGHFIRDWKRIRSFAGQDVAFLQEFVRELAAATSAQAALALDGCPSPCSPNDIQRMASRWINSVQVSEPRASLLGRDDLLTRMSAQFLAPAPARKRRAFRDRRQAVSLARRSLVSALAAAPAAQRKNVKMEPKLQVSGALDQHVFDAALLNGKPLLGVQGISFEGPSTVQQQREVDATAWTIDDIKKKHPELLIGVIALPPRHKGKTYATARKIFTGLGAEVVDEDGAAAWAARATEQVLA